MREDELPVISILAKEKRDPFLVLISTILSSRTKEEVTAEATRRLFERAKTPYAILQIPEEEISSLIYPVGFFRNKARVIRKICLELMERFNGNVPDSLDDLLTLPGVGRKTANLVLSLGFNKDGICVDTHVHRITNRLGYVKTKTPEETEKILRKILPLQYWKSINTLLVAFGRQICLPVSPFCSRCYLQEFCDRVNVTRSR
ncbi:MAG: endonuclease III [Syntrophales bacterium]|nr:endonuclease III [Syntrophales bacterium]